ncbi:MAG: TetR/AcrR family transcriptional regulator [Methanocella sp.]
MSVKRVARKTGRPAKVPGEKGTKEKIFDAAVDLFAERGYDGVSVRDIAREVGLTEGAVYRHYSGKDEILESIFAYVEGRIYPQAPEGSIDAMAEALSFREILETVPRFMMADPHLAKITRIMLIELYHNEKIGNYFRRELIERPIDETEVLFRKLMEHGKIRPCNPRAVATLFISYMVSWYFQTFILNYGELDFESIEKTTMAEIKLFADTFKPEGGRSS